MNYKTTDDQKFGIKLSIIFFILSMVLIFNKNYISFYISLSISIAILIVTHYSKTYLALIKKYWYKSSDLIGSITSPITLGIIYFIIISPLALILRYFGRDILRLNDIPTNTYWIKNNSDQISTLESFYNQY